MLIVSLLIKVNIWYIVHISGGFFYLKKDIKTKSNSQYDEHVAL